MAGLRKFLVCALVMAGASAKVESMVTSKMSMSDGASGYAYNQQQGLPASYVQYTNHYDVPKPVHYVSPVAIPVAQPIAAAIQYRPSLFPQQYARSEVVTVAHKNAPLAPYYPVAGSIEKSEPYRDFDEEEDDHEELNDEDFSDDSLESEDKEAATDAAHDADYVNGAGEIYDAGKYSAHGEKGENEYKARREFDKGDEGKYHEDHHKGWWALSDRRSLRPGNSGQSLSAS